MKLRRVRNEQRSSNPRTPVAVVGPLLIRHQNAVQSDRKRTRLTIYVTTGKGIPTHESFLMIASYPGQYTDTVLGRLYDDHNA